MKLTLIIIMQLFFIPVLCKAQGDLLSYNEFITLLPEGDPIGMPFNNAIGDNNLIIEQIGNNNVVYTNQTQNEYLSAFIYATQIGDRDFGFILQSGINHQTILYQDNSTGQCCADPNLGNEAHLFSEGVGTKNIALQVGNNNLINQFVENYYAETRSVASMQVGNNNKIELSLLDREQQNNLQEVTVTQTGNNNQAELVFNQSKASCFKIDQRGGAEIRIAQTDFYFPMK